jgi:glycosyltransferase involved in cell wall biosynthesis
MSAPLISLVLPVRNAMPHVRGTIEALRRQKYRNFELIIQDGASTDSTLDYLRSIDDLPRVEIVSAPDTGIGQAYNRGIARTKGDWMCLIAADEWLDDDALERGVRWFEQYPDAAVIYCGMRLVDATGGKPRVFIPPPFDLNRFLHNEISATATGFLNRKRIGSELYYDESLKSCPDYDFWIRLGSKFDSSALVVVPEVHNTALGDRTSMSYRVESFDQFIKDKLFILNRYVDSLGDDPETRALRTSASAGIHIWAAESIYALSGPSSQFVQCCRDAASLEPHSPRLARLARRSEVFEIDALGQFTVNPTPQPWSPPGETRAVAGLMDTREIYSDQSWLPAKVRKGSRFLSRRPTVIVTAPGPWNYSALIPLKSGMDPRLWYWAKLNVRVLSGQVGIGLLVPDDILSERLVGAEEGRVDVFVRLNRPSAAGIMIRNGSLNGGPSTVEVHSLTVECSPRVDSNPAAAGLRAATTG